MKNYIIAIGLRAPRATFDRLMERIDALVVELTQSGEVEALTTEIVEDVPREGGSYAAEQAERHEEEG